MPRRQEDHNSDLAALIDALAGKAGLSSDRAIAREAFLNNAVVSRLRRQKGGLAKFTGKTAILLGWGLNSNPITLAADIRNLLIAAGAAKPEYKQSISEIIRKHTDGTAVWAYVPQSLGFRDLYGELLAVGNQTPIKIFTTIGNARIVWEEQSHEADRNHTQKDVQTSKQIEIITPDEFVLSRDTALIVLNPNSPGTRKVYAWFPGLSSQLQSTLVEMPVTEILDRFIQHLNIESVCWSMYRLAFEEKEHGKKNNAVILLYADYFPEADEHVESQCLYDSIKANLINGARYLYINPYPENSTEGRRVDISFRKLRQKLSVDDNLEPNLLTEKTFAFKSFSQGNFYRQATFIVYGYMNTDSQNSHCELIKSNILKQCDGEPLRFTPLDSTSTAHLELTFLDGLMKEIDHWLQLGNK